jgi:hypothetical protein
MDTITMPGRQGTFTFTPKKNTDYYPEFMVHKISGKIIAECYDLIGLYPVGTLIQYPDGVKRFIKTEY